VLGKHWAARRFGLSAVPPRFLPNSFAESFHCVRKVAASTAKRTIACCSRSAGLPLSAILISTITGLFCDCRFRPPVRLRVVVFQQLGLLSS